MKTVSTWEEFLAMFDEHGVPKELFAVAEGVRLGGPNSITSLAGVTLAKGVQLFGLFEVKSLDGVKLAKGVRLCGLTGRALQQYWAMKK